MSEIEIFLALGEKRERKRLVTWARNEKLFSLVQSFKIAFSLLGPNEWAFSLLVDTRMRVVSVSETKCFNFYFKPRKWTKSK